MEAAHTGPLACCFCLCTHGHQDKQSGSIPGTPLILWPHDFRTNWTVLTFICPEMQHSTDYSSLGNTPDQDPRSWAFSSQCPFFLHSRMPAWPPLGLSFINPSLSLCPHLHLASLPSLGSTVCLSKGTLPFARPNLGNYKTAQSSLPPHPHSTTHFLVMLLIS